MISPLPPGWSNLGGVAAHRAKHDPGDRWESVNAIDMALPPGSPVYAIEDGVVDPSAGFGFRDDGKGVWGRRLTLDLDSGDSAFFAHLGGYAKGIAPGARVREGQVLGWLGNPPRFGPHLHFALRDGSPELVAYGPPRRTQQDRLRARQGFLAWAYWFLGVHAWRSYGPRNPRVRPDVPARVPRRWWRRLAMFVLSRQR